MKRINQVFIVLVLLILSLTGCQNLAGSSPVAVVVNGENISQKQLDLQYRLLKYEYEQQQGVSLDETRDQAMITKLKDSAYENLIVQTLIRQDAKKRNLAVSSAETDKALEQFKTAQNSANKSNGYQDFLTRLNMSENDVKTQIETLLLTSQLQEKVVSLEPVTDQQAQKYYQDYPSLFIDEGGLHIYHILVDNESLANQLLDRLNKGEEFKVLAQQYSIDPGSKEQGGDVGLVNEKTNFVPEFKQAALTLKPGQTFSKPVKSTFGYHIIKAGDKQASKKLSFIEVKEQIKQQLGYEQKDKGFSDYIHNLRNQAQIQDKRQS
jgi:peptidyl-prolyl cis-trans isomerase C/foldase protein PrsA